MFHLRYFVVVAEELNFSEAARRLHMATSPLSRRIKDLEHELDQQLFVRSTHRVELTAAGAALLPMARELLEGFTSLPWRLREASGEPRSVVLVGVPAALHPELRSRLQDLEERWRSVVDLRRWPGTTADLIAAVHDGTLGLALVRMPVSDSELEVVPVLSERLGAVVPADRFAGRKSVRLADLAAVPYVPAPAEIAPAYFTEIDRKLHEGGVRKRLKPPNAGYGGVAEIISGGMGFSVSMLDPESPIHGYALDNVAVLPFVDFTVELETALIWRRDRAERQLRSVVREVCDAFGVKPGETPGKSV